MDETRHGLLSDDALVHSSSTRGAVRKRCRCCALSLFAALGCSGVLLMATVTALVSSGKWCFSQFGHYAFALALLDGAHGGLFIDVGASDGITNSNSYLLETWYSYRGICVEPGPRKGLLAWTRPRCFKSNSPVGNVDGREVAFVAGARTSEHSHMQQGSGARTSTLGRLIKDFQTARGECTPECRPLEFGLVSVDVEGFERDVLEGFPFDKHKIKVLFVEENGKRASIKELVHKMSGMQFVGSHAADSIFTAPELAARAHALLHATKEDAELGAWKRARGIYATAEAFVMYCAPPGAGERGGR